MYQPLNKFGLRHIFLFFFVCVALVSKAQLKADFRADTVRGCPPLIVQFQDLSTGNPTSWKWDLGEGASSNDQNPGNIYLNPGVYTIQLTVSDGTDSNTVTKSQYIVVSSYPDVQFSANVVSGCSPLNVQFSDLSLPGSEMISQWEWDFGDGNTSSERSPEHRYLLDGEFTVALRVKNSAGCEKVGAQNSLISIKQAPQAAFTVSEASSCNPPATITFTNKSISSTPVSYEWRFGDGGTSADQSPVYTYNTRGNYTATLIATDTTGCVDSVSQAIVIGTVTPAFVVSDTVCQGAPVTFQNTSSPAIASARWDFGDGTSSTDISPVKRFLSSGTFNVKLRNNFGVCEDSVTRSVFVLPKPSVNFTYLPLQQSCTLPATVSFTSNVTPASSLLWLFGDNTTSTETNPVHLYTNYGSFPVSLAATAANGCTDTARSPTPITLNAADIVRFTGLPFTGCVPFAKKFAAVTNSPESIQSYSWNFGDGSTSTDSTPSYTYNTQGIYDVSLKITTVNGCTDSLTLKRAVVIGTKPKADFSAVPTVSCAADSIQFTDLSTQPVNTWRYRFGDGRTSALQNPLTRFRDTGYFNITLMVGNNGCMDTLIKRNYIYINGPVANFTTTSSCSTPYLKKFTNRSIAAPNIFWDFGDGSTSLDLNPEHTYATPGQYSVKLVASGVNCADSLVRIITVIDEKPQFVTNNKEFCKNSVTTFSASGVNAANITSFIWNFGDGTGDTSSASGEISYSYPVSGTFKPSLTLLDKAGCRTLYTDTVGLAVFGPTAGFTNPAGACLTSTITFTDTSRPFSNYPITSWEFDYGDGQSASFTAPQVPQFVHRYDTAGSYNVSLIVNDSYGCKDTLFKTTPVLITDPKADFSISDSIACSTSTIRFSNASAGTNLSHYWQFGDGSTSNLTEPVYKYTLQDTFSISLEVTDLLGCKATKIDSIIIGDVVASFVMSDSVVNCPPAQINFSNNSLYASRISWDFGDGGASSTKNPLHYFTNAGTYNITLTARGYGSCVSTYTQRLTVKGPSGSFTYNPLIRCAPATVSFSATAQNHNRFIWDFGDGTTLSTQATTLSHQYKSTGTYQPKIVLVDSVSGCIVPILGPDTIFVTNATSYIKAFNAVSCDTAGINFFDSSFLYLDSITVYNWSFGDGSTSSLANPYHKFSSPGIYPVTLSITTTGGCQSTSTPQQVKVVRSPRVLLNAHTPVCANDEVTFTAALAQADTSAIAWNWNLGNGSTSDLATPQTRYTSAGSFIVTSSATNSTGCTGTDTTILTVNGLPAVDAGQDSIICLGQSLMLTPSGAQSYVWQSDPTLSCNNCSNPVAKPTVPAIKYVVMGTSSDGCKQTDSLMVTVVQPFNVSIVPATDTICLGDRLRLTAAGADFYTWSPSSGLDNPGSASPNAAPTSTTTYTVTGTDYRNCFTSTASIPVVVYPIPVFNIIDSIITSAVGNTFILNTTSSPDVIRWQWQPPTGLSCTDCPAPIATPTINTSYKAIASNLGGCQAEDEVTLNIFCNNGNVYTPNTFSPNNDGMNDLFYPRGKGINQIKSIQIFNRLGTMVFRRTNFMPNDPQFGWNGTYKNQQLPTDVYIYQMEVICDNGQTLPMNGNITLIR